MNSLVGAQRVSHGRSANDGNSDMKYFERKQNSCRVRARGSWEGRVVIRTPDGLKAVYSWLARTTWYVRQQNSFLSDDIDHQLVPRVGAREKATVS